MSVAFSFLAVPDSYETPSNLMDPYSRIEEKGVEDGNVEASA